MHTTVLTTTRLHVLLALAAVLTGTAYGAAVATAVLVVAVLRGWAGAHLDARTAAGSGAGGARVLAGAEGRRLLQDARHARQRPAH